ncbi:MAG TPA: fructose 1,6-bisphosphatase, partial [Candidatus Methanoperedenaceae archaeon]|nr:fructose 1,6-bisphosphatase [Candidatus Methanoperedenaceae archaeon]
EAKRSRLIEDYCVLSVGDDLELLMGHKRGVDNKDIHELAWNTLMKATGVAKKLKLYGAGQDMLSDAFSGNVRGMGPCVAEMAFTERQAEPLVAFMMDKTEPGAFNLPIFRMFADPFNTAGLVIDPSLHSGFRFEVWDIQEHKRVFINTPEETYDLLALIGAKSRYVIKRVFPKENPKLPADEPAAVVSTEKLYQIAGEYVGKDDPVALVRAQSGLPALGEVLEPFAFPHLVSGWMRGSHNGPLMPVGFADARCTRFDGPPRVSAAGFQIANATLVGPVDLFDDPAFDLTRKKAQHVADYMRRHGPFEPHRLPMEDMQYTTMPKVLRKLEGRFEETE